MVGVCTNTLCAIMGGDAIFDTLVNHLGVRNDQTTPDGKITLQHVECNAACDYAPVVMVNWEFFDNQTPESARRLVDALRAGNRRGPPAVPAMPVPPNRTRAGRLPDEREIHTVGEATLAGLRVSLEKGMAAHGLEGQD
ncbi:NADH-quinone oxidoreductase subunit E [Mycobacterium xenopi 3993]|nr:NADH-quinone oxidoreductase subunit E [Mycobacterium xenopi 3993]